MSKWTEQNCPFCERIKKGEFTHEDEHCVAFPPLSPVVPGHYLVVPRVHAGSALGNPVSAGQAMAFAAFLANRLGVGSANFITSAGSQATQTVWHTHVHIVPREDDDGLALPWTAQQDGAALPLLEEAFFLRQNGERPPGGNESWPDWETRTELYLRSLAGPLEDQR